MLFRSVEDIHDVEFDDLLDIGIPNDIIEALRLVTKEPTSKKLTQEEKLRRYNEEIDKIIASGNNLALELKTADMSDNFNPDRMAKLPLEKLIWFNEKYGKNLAKLRKEKRKREC